MSTEISQNNKRIAKNTLLLYVRMMFIMIVSLYTSRLVLQILGVEDYGIYNVVGGVVSFIAFLNGSLNTATQRFLNYEMGRKNIEGMKSIFSMSLICYMGIAVVALFLAETVGYWFVTEKLVIPPQRLDAAIWVLHFSVATFVIHLFIVPYNAAVIAHEKMSIYAYISVGSVVMKLILIVVLQYVYYDKLWLYALMMMATSAIEALLYWGICLKLFEECHFQWRFDKHLFKGLFSFSGWMLSGTMTHLLYIQGVNILMNIYFGPACNAARAVAMQVNSAVSSFSTNFMTAVRPQIVKMYAEGNNNGMYRLVNNSSRFSFYLLFVMALPLILNMNLILELWLGDVPQDTVLFAQLVLVDLLIVSAYGPIAYVTQASGRIKEYQLMISLCFSAVVVFTWIVYGIGCAAYVTFAISIVVDLIGYFLRLLILKRIYSFPIIEYAKVVLFPIVKVATLSIVLLFMPLIFGYSVYNHFVGLIWSVLITGTTIWIVGMNKREKQLCTSKVRSIFIKTQS